MFTENGTVKIRTKVTAEAHRILNRRLLVLSIICIAVGAILLGLGVLDIVLTLIKDVEANADFALLYCGALIILCGVFCLIVYIKAGSMTAKVEREHELEFFSDRIAVTVYFNGEARSKIKIYYSDVTRVTEIKQYMCISTQYFGTLCMDESALNLAELNAVLALLGKPQRTAPVVAPAKPGKEVAPVGDPFAEVDAGQPDADQAGEEQAEQELKTEEPQDKADGE